MRTKPMLLLSVALAACQPELIDWRDDHDFVWEGEHVTIYGYGRAPEDACGGSFEALDRHSGSIIELFGYDPALHHDYLWMSHDVWKGKCRPGAGACTAYGVPWTRSVPDMHEAAHAVMHATHGPECPSALEEGVAEYLSGPRYHSDWTPTGPTYPAGIEDILTLAPLPYPEYERAGNFASFLFEQYGPEAVAGLCDEMPYFTTLDDWRDAIPKVLGVELSELLSEYEQYPRCHHQQYRARLWECAGEPDALADPNGEVVFDIEMDCAAADVIGPFGSRIVATRRLWFPEEMRTGVFIRGEDGEDAELDFNLQACAACSEHPSLYADTGLTTVFNFSPGMHELVVYAGSDFSETLSVHLKPF